jgi:hypothetical protein
MATQAVPIIGRHIGSAEASLDGTATRLFGQQSGIRNAYIIPLITKVVALMTIRLSFKKCHNPAFLLKMVVCDPPILMKSGAPAFRGGTPPLALNLKASGRVFRTPQRCRHGQRCFCRLRG